MKIIWTEPAIEDLEAIRDYIARDSEVYAASFIERIITAVEILVDLPEIGRMVPETDQPGIRELIFHEYRIIYRVQQNAVQILTVIHGSRDLNRRTPKPWEIT